VKCITLFFWFKVRYVWALYVLVISATVKQLTILFSLLWVCQTTSWHLYQCEVLRDVFSLTLSISLCSLPSRCCCRRTVLLIWGWKSERYSEFLFEDHFATFVRKDRGKSLKLRVIRIQQLFILSNADHLPSCYMKCKLCSISQNSIEEYKTDKSIVLRVN
jgi:hypothetical protein